MFYYYVGVDRGTAHVGRLPRVQGANFLTIKKEWRLGYDGHLDPMRFKTMREAASVLHQVADVVRISRSQIPGITYDIDGQVAQLFYKDRK